MLKVKTDLLDAINQKKVVCLVLLDLSATFDTVNHEYLLNHLKYRFRVDGTSWLGLQIASQIEHREWSSMVNKVRSNLTQ